MSKWLVIFVVLILLGAGGWVWYAKHEATATYHFKTVKVERGDLVVTINATGTLEPEETVDVGAQVTGIVKEFGTDVDGKSIDYGSEIKANTLLAKIDDRLFVADVTSAKATVDQQKAGVARAEADIKQLQALLAKAQADWERAQRLGVSDALAQADYDTYKSAYETAMANVAVGEASLAQAKSLVPQAEASLQRAQQNLDYCTIVSPVDGFVIDRRVNVGQTVVSSLSASSMFLIGKDRHVMTILGNVNEADIGKIKVAQPVMFTVDAFPDQKFHGKVTRIRWNAVSTSNVVVYTVEIDVDNENLTLIPYLTANVNFQVAKHENVLEVPNAALRWAPTSTEMIQPDLREKYASMAATSTRTGGGSGFGGGAGGGAAGAGAGRRSRDGSAGGGRPGAATQPGAPMSDDGKGGPTTRRSHRGEDGGSSENQHGTVWLLVGNFVKPITVTIGPNDGINTEIKTDELKESDQLVTGEITATEAAADDTTNPFAPKFPGRGGGGGGGRR